MAAGNRTNGLDTVESARPKVGMSGTLWAEARVARREDISKPTDKSAARIGYLGYSSG